MKTMVILAMSIALIGFATIPTIGAAEAYSSAPLAPPVNPLKVGMNGENAQLETLMSEVGGSQTSSVTDLLSAACVGCSAVCLLNSCTVCCSKDSPTPKCGCDMLGIQPSCTCTGGGSTLARV